ncbi:MAG: Ca-activated chloride channel [Blastocatellia bacterium]|jgi:VWFA-related protein|nr:Ca-activated chloride channel [Blastocatellia bacterium]
MILMATTIPLSQTPSLPANDDFDVIKTDTNLVTVNVAAIKKHRPVPGLSLANFAISDNGKPVNPTFFEADGPASIIFIIDISASMTGRKWTNLKDGLKEFLKRRKESDYTVITFNENPTLLAQSIPKDEFWKLFGRIKPKGETALYDALTTGLDQLGCLTRRRKAIVLLSDGEDTRSHADLATVQEAVFHAHTTIYAIGIIIDSSQPDRYRGRDLLEQLASSTGGVSFYPTAEQLGETLDRVSKEIEQQYSFGYYANDRTLGWRTIDVRLTPPMQDTSLRYQTRYLFK